MPGNHDRPRPPQVQRKIIKHIEEQECTKGVATPHNHWLQTTKDGDVVCVYCKVSWGDLDAQLNGATR